MSFEKGDRVLYREDLLLSEGIVLAIQTDGKCLVRWTDNDIDDLYFPEQLVLIDWEPKNLRDKEKKEEECLRDVLKVLKMYRKY